MVRDPEVLRQPLRKPSSSTGCCRSRCGGGCCCCCGRLAARIRTKSLEHYVSLLNVTTAKVVALALFVLFGLVYHGVLHMIYGVTPCKGLLKDGIFKAGTTAFNFRGDFDQGTGLWQPWGCMMHNYSDIDSDRCFRSNGFYGRSNHFVFVGDSRMHQIYSGTVAFFAGDSSPVSGLAYQQRQPKNQDEAWRSRRQNLKLEFYWSPFIDRDTSKVFDKWKSTDSRLEDVPDVIVIGCADQIIRSTNSSLEGLASYSSNLTLLSESLERIILNGDTKILWMVQSHVNTLKLTESHPGDNRFELVTDSAMESYNRRSAMVLSNLSATHPSQMVIWSSFSRIANLVVDQMEDGFHYPDSVVHQATLMLVNLHCNEAMNFNDGSCCKSSDKTTSLQLITFAVFGCCTLFHLLKASYCYFCYTGSRGNLGYEGLQGRQSRGYQYMALTLEDEEEANRVGGLFAPNRLASAVGPPELDTILWAITKLGLILAYFYVCDRTNFLLKENKYFTHMNFLLPMTYLICVGLFFHEKSKYIGFLNKDQTDEWKGWMQLVILIYQMTGGEEHVALYMHVKVLISSYLFLHGYGHFMYMWRRPLFVTKGVLFIRFIQVIFRMNLLAVLLCLAMNRPYQFYFYVPLISMWFLFQFVILIIPPKVTVVSSENRPIQYLYILLKLAFMVLIICILSVSKVFFEKVFVTRPWKALFVSTDDDITGWWQRWKLDRFSVVYGLTFAFCTSMAHRCKLFSDTGTGSNASTAGDDASWPSGGGLASKAALHSLRGFLKTRLFKGLVVLLCLAAIGGYTLFANLCNKKESCGEAHPYLVILPIVGYVLLRNVSDLMRRYHSSFFAWFGRIGLELFVAQYHIWLAADTHGVLVLIPNYPVVNILLTSFIFVCVAHEVHQVTNVLVRAFVPENNLKVVLRTTVVFLLVLVAIGISDGMF